MSTLKVLREVTKDPDEVFVIDGDKVTTLYSDDLELLNLGKAVHERAASVEPTSGGRWRVETSDSNILPIQYRNFHVGTFDTRKEALAAEVHFLQVIVFKKGE